MEIRKEVLDLIFLYTKNELLRGNGFTMYSKHPELFMLMRRIEAKRIQKSWLFKKSFVCVFGTYYMFGLTKIFIVIAGKLLF